MEVGSGLGEFSPDSTFGNFSDAAMDLDFMDQLLFEGCQLETSDGFNLMQPGPSTSSGLNDPDPFQCIPVSGSYTVPFSINSHRMYQGETESQVPSPPYTTIEDLSESQSPNWAAVGNTTSLSQPGNVIVQGTELGSRWWIGPRAESNSSLSVKERLMQAIGYLKESTKDMDVLIQIWVPVQREGKHFLTTEGQPYFLNTNCQSLKFFRDVSKSYNVPAEEDSKESVGLLGRVFLGKLPEWTPDVRFFRSDEYPRIDFAQKYNVGGSLALPVFERASGTCLGVVEIVTTTQKINYRSELEHVCKALEAVDLRSSYNFIPCVEACNELYQAALPEIAEVLRSVCKIYKLPLALTWAQCLDQFNSGCQLSDENFYHCVVDTACFVADEDFSDFLEACSEHHLLRGQGIVGRAFTTNKQCFANDITAFSKRNYPLSHYARMFGLRGAVAIPLRSTFTGSVELVLELFLPKDCQDSEAQKQMLNSLSSFMQRACQSFYVVVDKELEEEVILPVKEMVVTSDGKSERSDKEETQFRISSSKENSPEESSWIAHMMEAQQKGKGVSVSWEYQKEEPIEEFKVTTHWEDTQLELYNKQVLSDFGQLHQNAGTKASVEGGSGDSSPSGGHRILAGKKAGEKRRTKMEKTISLQVLRQYFAGSLKDAAKSIGVCPTTLKRICRQHGITRWPSRKIKKVGHSLKKLQLVIDSVKGAEGAIQLGSFYSSFPELSSPNFSGNGLSSSLKISSHSKPSEPQLERGMFSQGAAASKSPSSSCSPSSCSSTSCSTGSKQHNTSMNALCGADELTVEDPDGAPKRALSYAELHALNQEEPKLTARAQSHKTFGELPSFGTLPPLPKRVDQNLRAVGALRVKAMFGESKIRFSLQPSWSFKDLQQEIAKRFNIEDVSRIDLQYLDDDNEWVLLTCNADLEECIDIYKSSQSHTIKISLHQASHPNLGSSFCSSAPL